tara:strand:- start:2471 stop:2605 length:135 start_codon:yes stop_codon:yes gene_type:complete
MNPMVEVGDFRVMTNGDRVVWTLRGWELAGAEKCMEENFGVEEE